MQKCRENMDNSKLRMSEMLHPGRAVYAGSISANSVNLLICFIMQFLKNVKEKLEIIKLFTIIVIHF